jgi:hypothetical protein
VEAVAVAEVLAVVIAASAIVVVVVIMVDEVLGRGGRVL